MTTTTTTTKPQADLLPRHPHSFAVVGMERIKAGLNPRTDFDLAELESLAQSMKDLGGPIQPPVVYLDDDGMYALIAGERRWRAAQLAGLLTLEVIVWAKPGAKDVRKMALVENMQRKDLTPLEIARAIADMLALTNEVGVPVYNQAQLADELGLSARDMARYLALLKGSERLQKAVHAKTVELEIAAMVASLPADMHETAEAEIVFGSGGVMKRDDARERVAGYRRDLRKAQFDRSSATLVEGKPACADCEFNGSRRSDIQGKNAWAVCLNPACFEAKQMAFVTLSQTHTEEGVAPRQLGQEVANKVFSFDGVTLKGDSGYVAADVPPDEGVLVNPNAKTPTWGALLKQSGLETVSVLDGEGRLRTLYDAKLALEAGRTAHPAVFKGGAKAASGAGGGSVKISTDDTKDAAAKESAGEEARAKGIVLAGQKWFEAMDNDHREEVMDALRWLLVQRLTEPADREWMAVVLSGDAAMKGHLERIMADYPLGSTPALMGLALVARSMRLQGPGTIKGITGTLCETLGYDPKAEAKAVEEMVKAAQAALDKAKPEQLFDCPKCGGKNFTKRGLKSHNCERRVKKKAEQAGEGTTDHTDGGVTESDYPLNTKLEFRGDEHFHWGESLLDAVIKPTEPNEFGVNVGAKEFVIAIPGEKKGELSISVGYTDDGTWWLGSHYDLPSKTGRTTVSAGMGASDRFESRAKGVFTHMLSLRKQLASDFCKCPKGIGLIDEVVEMARSWGCETVIDDLLGREAPATAETVYQAPVAADEVAF